MSSLGCLSSSCASMKRHPSPNYRTSCRMTDDPLDMLTKCGLMCTLAMSAYKVFYSHGNVHRGSQQRTILLVFSGSRHETSRCCIIWGSHTSWTLPVDLLMSTLDVAFTEICPWSWGWWFFRVRRERVLLFDGEVYTGSVIKKWWVQL